MAGGLASASYSGGHDPLRNVFIVAKKRVTWPKATFFLEFLLVLWLCWRVIASFSTLEVIDIAETRRWLRGVRSGPRRRKRV